MTVPGNVVIRPFFCTDSDAILGEPTTLSLCISRLQTLTLYFKTDLLSVTFNGRLSIVNIVFDGSENIEFFNPTGTAV
jgi:hypothetical protein